MSSLFRPLVRSPATLPRLFKSSPLLLARSAVLVGPSKRYAGHAPHSGNQAGGWMFGERPRHPLAPRPKELWQSLVVGPMVVYIAIVCTMMYYGGGRMQEWARITARRRMEDEGRFPTFTPTVSAHVNFHPVDPDQEIFHPSPRETPIKPW